MGHEKKAEYISILGSPAKPVVVELVLPRIGEYDSKWVIAETVGKEYFHYGHKVHPKAQPVNVHVYGAREHIIYLAKTGTPVKYGLELVLKKTVSGREFIFVNLTVLKRLLPPSHVFAVTNCSPDPQKRDEWVYTTRDMNGIGISVEPLR